MNAFEKHLAAMPTKAAPTPEWIKRAKKNLRAQVKRFATKHCCSEEEARERLMFALENMMQG